MAGWKDKLREGSFRGAPFLVESSDDVLGRRVELHEFPLRDEPYAEDLGRLARGWTLDLYVLGPNYMEARDKLREALEAEGPGQLVHPWLGTVSAQVRGEVRMRQSWREGGMARFSVTFCEPGAPARPDTQPDTAARVSSAASGASVSSRDAFGSAWKSSGPERVRNAQLARVTGFMNKLSSTISGAATNPAGVGRYVSEAQTVSGSLSGLIGSPMALARSTWNLLSLVRMAALSPLSALNMYLSLASFGLDWFTGGGLGALSAINSGVSPYSLGMTPTAAQIMGNDAAFGALVRQAAVTGAAVTTSEMTWESADAALADRDAVAEALDAEAMSAPDPVYRSLTALRAAVVTDVTTRGAQLPALSTVTLQQSMPALAAAHRIHGDATLADELVARNRVRHPGNVPGLVPLEVLRG